MDGIDRVAIGCAAIVGAGGGSSGADEVAAIAARLQQTGLLAAALVRAGRRVDLAGFDDQVGLLCAKVLDRAPDEAVQLRPLLTSLREVIDRLEGVMRTQGTCADRGPGPERSGM